MKNKKRVRPPGYAVWIRMKQRCCNPNATGYENYGGRGVTICESWMNSFEAFVSDMGPRPSKSHTVERIDNSKGYCKENCRWATKLEQNRNKRNNHVITIDGVSKTIGAWAEEKGINPETLSHRINVTKWTYEKAISTPVRPRKEKGDHPSSVKIVFDGISKNIKEWIELFGVSRNEYRKICLKTGSPENAIKHFVETTGKNP